MTLALFSRSHLHFEMLKFDQNRVFLMISLEWNNIFQINLMYCIIVAKFRVDMILGDLHLVFKVSSEGHHL